MPNQSSESTPVSNQAVLLPLPPEEWPSIDHIITEDGAPVDSIFSEKQMRLLTEPLHSSWKPEYPFVALANVGLFYGLDFPPIVPDVLVSVKVRLPESLFPKYGRSYFVWKYGKPPEVAIEIVSNRKGGEDTAKLEIYADIRVSQYIIYDPEHYLSDQELRQFKLNGKKLILDETVPCSIPEIGLNLTIWSGRYEDTDSRWLRWTNHEGQLLPTGQEKAEQESRRAESEFQRAESESQRAATEAMRADAAAQQNARLAELLRSHGINPELLP